MNAKERAGLAIQLSLPFFKWSSNAQVMNISERRAYLLGGDPRARV